jgi:hypothetical protein
MEAMKLAELEMAAHEADDTARQMDMLVRFLCWPPITLGRCILLKSRHGQLTGVLLLLT